MRDEDGNPLVCAMTELRRENEQLRDALVTARDFIVGHPAVQGTWPLLIEVIDKALGEPTKHPVDRCGDPNCGGEW